MVYFCIRAHCLAQQQEWKREYEDIIKLKKDIFDYFQLYNINEECGLIVYYDENEKCDQIFDSLDILPRDNTTVFDLYVKRVSCFYVANNRFLYIFDSYGLVVVFVLVHLI